MIDDVPPLPLKSLAALGSIETGSNRLHLNENPGFKISDSVIVEVGGEEGRGLRGTRGVGGAWPDLSYKNKDAMHADWRQPSNTYAWIEETGDVFQYVSQAWIQNNPRYYYSAKAVPKALVARITAIEGDVLILDAGALATSVNARVYFDNLSVLDSVNKHRLGWAPTTRMSLLPRGAFAISGRVSMAGLRNWTVAGQGNQATTIFSPRGTPSVSMLFFGCSGVAIKDLHLQGNLALDGFGLYMPKNATRVAGESYPSGIKFGRSINCEASNITITNVFQVAVGTSFCVDVWARHCDAVLTVPMMQYVQWMFLWADSVGGGIIDCSVTSEFLAPGIEIFRSDGVHFIRPKLRNAVISCNGSGRFLLDEPTIVIDENSQFSDESFSRNNPVINVSSNIQPPDRSIGLGGVIRNPTIVQKGYINNTKDRLQNINVNANNPNIRIEGGYPDTPTAGGLIQSLDYIPGTYAYGGVGIFAPSVSVSVSGIRVVGTASSPKIGNINVAPGSSVSNCVADVIVGVSEPSNLTNTEWQKKFGDVYK